MHDALLIVSFGGPERPQDVLPFLENVTQGRNVPRERLLKIAQHYYHFGGKSPINEQCRDLIAALGNELQAHGLKLPIYWGNRNWHPFLADTLREMRKDGVRHAFAFVTSAYSSYSGCRQYRENIATAQAEIGPGAPAIDKLPVFYNHPGFVEACADRVRQATEPFLRNEADPFRLVISAHSIPTSMAATSDYERQLRETSRLVAETLGIGSWDLVFQSRSGRPNEPWLGPDILDHLRRLHGEGVTNVLVAPVGFVSDHLEVIYDLDTESAALAQELGMKFVRAETVGTHPAFVRMIRQLIENWDPTRDVCPADCCPAPSTVYTPAASEAETVSQRP
jgi:protoporphyrin/coproporphyrin ferrochelatase